MPELAEVETVVRTLEHQLGQVTIKACQVLYPRMVEADFAQRIINHTIQGYSRHGKYLIFDLGDLTWITHLRMEGKFYIQNPEEEISKHVHIILTLDNGLQLRYHDTRKFGRMYLYEPQSDVLAYPCMKNIGYDLFDERLDVTYLKNKLLNKKTTLKQVLLDQSIIAGIGNIYSDEIAFALKLHPETKINVLTDDDLAKLIEVSRDILSRAIECGGTTIRSYTSSLGVDGRFQLSLKVHTRQNLPCFNCNTIIKKIVVGGRGTYYCEFCQIKK